MLRISRIEFFFLISFLTLTISLVSGSTGGGNLLSNAIQEISRRGQTTLSTSIPALSLHNMQEGSPRPRVVDVGVKRKRRRSILSQVPKELSSQLENGGFYYGITPSTFSKATAKMDIMKRPSLSDSMFEALEELRILRQEMETMRKEMQALKRKMVADGEIEEDSEEVKAKVLMLKRKRQREAEKLASEIEIWAQKIMKETEDDGWKEVSCNKMMRGLLNGNDRTKVYIKWMTDSRGEKADKSDDNEYPCIKCSTTIDAPLEDVCTYLSQENAAPDYNELVVRYKDVEEISPSAKICWSQSPQILFLKPRDFVTFCHHRWRRDGSEVIVNQAWDHPDYPANKEERDGKACRAYALRGANVFSRCPDAPDKTIISLVAHANPGGGVPPWASRTAVNALAPIEPFKLFHKINENVRRNHHQLRERLQQAEMVSTLPPGRSPRPAGMAQLGYACFWPNGGGIEEGGNKRAVPEKGTDDSEGKDQRMEGGSEMDSGVDSNDSEKQSGRNPVTEDEIVASL